MESKTLTIHGAVALPVAPSTCRSFNAHHLAAASTCQTGLAATATGLAATATGHAATATGLAATATGHAATATGLAATATGLAATATGHAATATGLSATKTPVSKLGATRVAVAPNSADSGHHAYAAHARGLDNQACAGNVHATCGATTFDHANNISSGVSLSVRHVARPTEVDESSTATNGKSETAATAATRCDVAPPRNHASKNAGLSRLPNFGMPNRKPGPGNEVPAKRDVSGMVKTGESVAVAGMKRAAAVRCVCVCVCVCVCFYVYMYVLVYNELRKEDGI